MGIGPTQPAWKAGALPLCYTRTFFLLISNQHTHILPRNYLIVNNIFSKSLFFLIFYINPPKNNNLSIIFFKFGIVFCNFICYNSIKFECVDHRIRYLNY